MKYLAVIPFLMGILSIATFIFDGHSTIPLVNTVLCGVCTWLCLVSEDKNA